MKRYYKCSVETADEYKSVGFILRGKGNIEDKIAKFFTHSGLLYDGVFLPLTECAKSDLGSLNFIFKESIFGTFYQVK